MAKANLSADRLREILHYDPETGIFSRKMAISNRSRVGDLCTAKSKKGYLRASVDGSMQHLHRLAWLYMYGSLPSGVVDHINGDKTDDISSPRNGSPWLVLGSLR